MAFDLILHAGECREDFFRFFSPFHITVFKVIPALPQ
jgi:hypothetical protein